MRRKISGHYAIIKHICTSLHVDKHQNQFIKWSKQVWGSWKKTDTNSVILADFYPVQEQLMIRSYLLNILAKKYDAKITTFYKKSLLGNRVFKKIYRAMNVADHIELGFSKTRTEKARKMAAESLTKIESKNQLIDYSYREIWVGIDIYETYLREYNLPTVDLHDEKLLKLIAYAILCVDYFLAYFAENNVKAVVVSHDCYIPNDIVCKVAYVRATPVYLPNNQSIVYAQKPFSVYERVKHYREKFSSFSPEQQNEAREWGRNQLETRLSGGLDVQQQKYVVASAYAKPIQDRRFIQESDKVKVIVLTHCFYDNPHAYHRVMFPDYYEWIKFLIKISEVTDYDWYIKTHPKPRDGTIETIKELINNTVKFTLLPPEVSHHQIVQEGIDVALTVHGSIGFEYPLMGVQVINAGFNPQISYGFNWHAKSMEEYEKLLLSLSGLKLNIDKKEVYECYYMHQKYCFSDDILFKSYRKLLHESLIDIRTSKVLSIFLDELHNDSKRHDEIIQKISRFIDSKKQYNFSELNSYL